jgi:hypothetical protein
MSGFLRVLLILVLLVGYGGIAWHSIGEIHYLKGFFPARFTVQEAFWAAWVEVAKLVIIGCPLGLAVVSLTLWRGKSRE